MTRRVALAALALTLVVVLSPHGQAQYPPSPTPTSTPSATATPEPGAPACRTRNSAGDPDTTFARGERFFVEGSGIGRLDVDILLDNRTNIGSGRARRDDTFSVAAQIPNSAAGGAHTISARGAGGRTATCNISVSGSAGLPRTGTDVAVLTAWGIAFLLTGTLFVLYARRRRSPAFVDPPASFTWTEEDILWTSEWRDER